MLASSLVAPAAALSTSGLVVGDTTINLPTTYTLTFNLGVTLPAGLAAITVVFPTGTTFSSPSATIQAGAGLGTPIVTTAAVTIHNTSGTTMTVDTVANMGAGAIVQLIFSGIINPPTIGTYPVTLATATETTAIQLVPSPQPFLIVTPLPGTASVYNTAGILMFQSVSLTTALGYVNTPVLIKRPSS